MAIEIFNRQELKFVISHQQYAQILRRIQPFVMPDKHNKNGQTYRLYNLYIDTADHALIRHSMTKPVVYKEKLRIRSYADFAANPMVFLEVKNATSASPTSVEPNYPTMKLCSLSLLANFRNYMTT